MKKQILGAIVAGTMLVTSGVAFAATYVDSIDYGSPGVLITTSSPKTDHFDLNGVAANEHPHPLFDLDIMHVTSASATFWFKDDAMLDGDEGVSVTIEHILGQGGSFGYLDGTVSFTTVLGAGQIASSLNVDGIAEFTITSTSGDFYLKDAQLTACTAPGGALPTPDGGLTSMMLGMGILSIAGLRRKFGI